VQIPSHADDAVAAAAIAVLEETAKCFVKFKMVKSPVTLKSLV